MGGVCGSVGVSRRCAPDGSWYTLDEFIEFYGGTSEWDAAAQSEKAASPWVRDEDEQGRAYFFNKLTRESSWTQPKDYDAADDIRLGGSKLGEPNFGKANSQVNIKEEKSTI